MKCFQEKLSRQVMSRASLRKGMMGGAPVRFAGTMANSKTKTKTVDASPSRHFSSNAKKPVRKVLIPTRLDGVAKTVLENNDFKVVQDGEASLEELVNLHGDADAMIVRSEKVTPEIMEKLPKLKLVVRAGAGYNTIDTKDARKRAIDVMNTPGANANAVAEEVIAMTMALMRHIVPGDISTREGKWEKKKFMGSELTGKVIGIVGLGNIGQLLIKRLKGFEVTVVGFDPMVSESKAEDLGVKLVSLDYMFRSCDVVSLHIPETEETRNMFNSTYFNKMKDGAILVNCARSGIVCEKSLREYKQKSNKKLLYATDVYPKDEAGVKPVHDIADLMLPHIGANTKEANFNAASRAASQTVGYFHQSIAEHVVNRDTPVGLAGQHMKLAYYVAEVALAALKGAKGQEDSQPLMMDTTFYGNLQQFSKYLVAPVVMGISKQDFDPSFGYDESIKFIENKGIAYNNRAPREEALYGDSITVDLVSGKGNSYNKVSVRGTIADGVPMISRVGDFDGLYLNPLGHTLLLEYQDTVGVVAAITQVLARYNVNVLDIRAPHDAASGLSMCLVKIDQGLQKETVQDIQILTRAFRCSYFNLRA